VHVHGLAVVAVSAPHARVGEIDADRRHRLTAGLGDERLAAVDTPCDVVRRETAGRPLLDTTVGEPAGGFTEDADDNVEVG
jgi:hypothetical protein